MTNRLKHILCIAICVGGLTLPGTSSYAQTSDGDIEQLFLTTTIVAVVAVGLPMTSIIGVSVLGAGGAVALTNKKPTEGDATLLNEYIARNEVQLAMDVTLGAGPSINELAVLIGYQHAPDVLRAYMKLHRRAILKVAKMSAGQARGRALFHVLRRIKPLPQ